MNNNNSPLRVSKSVQGAVRQFSLWIANGSAGYPLLNGIDYLSEFKESPSFMEQVFAVFMNNLELDENGNPNHENENNMLRIWNG